MPPITHKAALFDLDGVVLNTETQYSIIWGRIGRQYHPEMPDFSRRIKGMTLVNIFATYFDPSQEGMAQAQIDIERALDEFEAGEMVYEFRPGAREYLLALREAGVKTALVTSSNKRKMASVRAVFPQFDNLFDAVVTSELTKRSKPAPDCFLKGAELLGFSPEECVVFEDSKNGLLAGKASGSLTVGVASTFAREEIAPLAHEVIDTFEGLEVERFFGE